jgi:cysteine desulfurase/selenocysteine lyase
VSAPAPTGTATLDVARIRRDFPIFAREVNGRPLVYLDSAASSQKPRAVIEAMERCHREYYANVHRGVYTIAEESTAAFEAARLAVARFVGSPDPREIVFVRNATEAINLVAYSWARSNLRAGDSVVLTEMEHHANVVPWQILAEERGVELRWLPVTDDHRLDTSGLERALGGTRLLAVTAMSNVLGTINDIRPLADAAHAAGALILVDACQSAPHLPTDVGAWDADFVAFSAHKMLGPTGIGALWARAELLEAMPPFMGGGEMIRDVRLDGFTTNDVPWKFEAGTPAFVEAIGWAEAVRYLDALGVEAVRAHEKALTAYTLDALDARFGPSLHVYGPRDPEARGSALSFLFEGIHAHDISQVLDQWAVCVRAGHHCAKPLMRRLGVPATSRASFYVYNDESDADALVDALAEAERFFAL